MDRLYSFFALDFHITLQSVTQKFNLKFELVVYQFERVKGLQSLIKIPLNIRIRRSCSIRNNKVISEKKNFQEKTEYIPSSAFFRKVRMQSM